MATVQFSDLKSQMRGADESRPLLVDEITVSHSAVGQGLGSGGVVLTARSRDSRTGREVVGLPAGSQTWRFAARSSLSAQIVNRA